MKRLLLVPRYRVPASPLSSFTIRAAGFYALAQGVIILASSPIRFGGPSYAVLRQLPGSPWSWGISACAFGVLILLGSYRKHWKLKAIGLLCLSSWAFVFGAGALGAIAILPNAGTTGPPTYGLLGVWLATLVWVDEGGSANDDQAQDRPLG